MRKPKLLDDWKAVAKRSWSLWAIYIGAVFLGLDSLFTVFGVDWMPLSETGKRAVVFLVLVAAAYFRLVPQTGKSKI